MSRQLLLGLVLASFFYISWTGIELGAGISAEGFYFFLLFGLFSAIATLLLVSKRFAFGKLFTLHTAIALLLSATALWAPSIGLSLKYILTLLYVWMFHLFAYSLPLSDGTPLVASIERSIRYFVVLTIVSIGAGILLFGTSFSVEDGITDNSPGVLFFAPLDLVSVAVFILAARRLNGTRSPADMMWISIYGLVLLLNFSKTYMAATALAITLTYSLCVRSRLAKSIPIVLMSIIGYVLVTTDNPFSRQLFFDAIDFVDQGQLDASSLADAINTSGRIAIWSYLYDIVATDWRGLLFGHGIGSTEHFLSTAPFGGAGLTPHSDYVRILVEFGIAGLFVYLSLLSYLTLKMANTVIVESGGVLRGYAICILMIVLFIFFGGLAYEFLNRHRTLLVALVLLIGLYDRQARATDEARSENPVVSTSPVATSQA